MIRPSAAEPGRPFLFVSACVLILIVASSPPAAACTAFLVSGGKTVLAGNNEDFWNPNTQVRFVPAGEGRYGCVFFGFDDAPLQGGMNEKGLFFDGFATAPNPVEKTKHLPTLRGNSLDAAMAQCATVEEVVDFFNAHDRSYMERFMLFFGDATGDAVIIEGDALVRKTGTFQVITNFYQSERSEPLKACRRFRTATRILEKAEKPDIDLCTRILDATHADGPAKTLYSNVYDLKKRTVHLYHFFDFEHAVVFDLKKELAKGARTLKLPELFPGKTAAEAFRKEYARTAGKKRAALKAVELKPEELERYAGTYRIAEGDSKGDTVELVVDEGKLVHRTEGNGRRELIPLSRTHFVIFSLQTRVDVTFEGVTDGTPATAFVAAWEGGSARGERVE